jgi:multidrug efflux pump subunit AcrA (membrane-fusion protein)
MISDQRKRSRFWVLVLLTLLVTGAAMGGLHRLQQPPDESVGTGAPPAESAGPDSAPTDSAQVPDRAIALEGERIALRSVQRSVGAVGSFFGYDELTVRAQVTGRVAKVFHDVGDIVHPGDVLMELDKTDLDLDLEQTWRALELEVTRLGIDVPDKPLSLDDIALRMSAFKIANLPSWKRAEQLEQVAAQRFERAKQLIEANAMSKEEFQQRTSEYDVAKSTFDQAKYDAKAALAAVRHRVVLLRIAMRQLDLATICVPTPTRRESMPEQVQYAVVSRKATEGEMLKDAPGSSTATFELVMDGVLKMDSQVPERYTAEVKEGQDAQIQVDAYPDRAFTGKVVRINPTVDRDSRTFSVRIYVQNSNRELKAGGFAEVNILTRVDPQAWTVSPECIVTYAGSTRIFVVRDGKAHTISVETGIEGSGWVELLHAANADLREDDILIRGGQDKLAEGVPVQIRNTAELGQTAVNPSAAR